MNRKLINTIFAVTAVWFFGGCGASNYYILSNISTPKTTYAKNLQMIGIEKVSVPKYLFKREIAIARSNSEVSFFNNAEWAEDMDEGLTHRLIGFVQKKFNQPQVYAYPWGLDKQPDIKISVQITRYIAFGDQVYLDANWRIENMYTHKSSARLFTVAVPTKQDSKSIVDAMDRAFGKLEDDLAKGLYKF
ncbi:MAG: membrane integrity-associated transporter subunit PqiC [Campylobacterales bacterium]|nr:membrane integrity-associated transporter subunit PqiC [Campylobacterales bacterium]